MVEQKLKELRAAYYCCSEEIKDLILIEIKKLENLKLEEESCPVNMDEILQIN